jgi:hypothetical protein
MSEVTTEDKLRAMPRIVEAARTLWIWGLTTERPEEALHRFVQTNPDLKARTDEKTDPRAQRRN